MKKNVFNILLIIVSSLLLGSCSATKDEMAESSGGGKSCTPIRDILTKADASTKLPMLTIYDDTDKRDKGIVTWLSDKVTMTVRTAALKIYLKIALNVDFRFTVAILMTLSVIIFTASVILGLIQANGYNALMFLLKLIIVYNLTINYYYFDVYVIESFEGLISDALLFTSLTFSDYLSATTQTMCFSVLGQACDPVGILSSVFGVPAVGDLLRLLGLDGPSLVPGSLDRLTLFGAMDEQLSRFFNFDYWKVILAISSTGYTGIFWALAMAVLIITYFFAIMMAVKTFLMATIARFVLYGLGPIFITFALFNQTRSLFDGWLQQLISFTLQPIFLFIFLGMFHTMLAGFTESTYAAVGTYVKQMSSTCNPGDAGCTSSTCTTEQGCGADHLIWKKDVTNQWKGMCVGWGPIYKDSNLNWYRLCDDEKCAKDSGIAPVIPVDIWTLLSAIIVCYLMMAMCSWVVEIANVLASGAVTLTDAKVQGWDRLKSSVKGGVKQGMGSLMRSGPPTDSGKPTGLH